MVQKSGKDHEIGMIWKKRIENWNYLLKQELTVCFSKMIRYSEMS